MSGSHQLRTTTAALPPYFREDTDGEISDEPDGVLSDSGPEDQQEVNGRDDDFDDDDDYHSGYDEDTAPQDIELALDGVQPTVAGVPANGVSARRRRPQQQQQVACWRSHT